MSVESGRYFVEGEQPPLSSAEDEIVRRFHDLYYRRWYTGADTMNLSWFGAPHRSQTKVWPNLMF